MISSDRAARLGSAFHPFLWLHPYAPREPLGSGAVACALKARSRRRLRIRRIRYPDDVLTTSRLPVSPPVHQRHPPCRRARCGPFGAWINLGDTRRRLAGWAGTITCRRPLTTDFWAFFSLSKAIA